MVAGGGSSRLYYSHYVIDILFFGKVGPALESFV